MEGLFMEHNGAKIGLKPQDGAAGVETARLGLKEGKKAVIAIVFDDSAGATVQATLRQHDAAAAGTSKDLDVKANYYYKLASDASFTKVEKRVNDTTLAALIDLSTEIAANEAILVIEVLDSHLDVNNGFDHVSVSLAAFGGVKNVAAVMVLRDASHQAAYELEL